MRKIVNIGATVSEKDWKEIPNKEWVIDELKSFCTRALAKYAKGQREHGNHILEHDCLMEAQDEVIDLMFYLGAEKEIQRLRLENGR